MFSGYAGRLSLWSEKLFNFRQSKRESDIRGHLLETPNANQAIAPDSYLGESRSLPQSANRVLRLCDVLKTTKRKWLTGRKVKTSKF